VILFISLVIIAYISVIRLKSITLLFLQQLFTFPWLNLLATSDHNLRVTIVTKETKLLLIDACKTLQMFQYHYKS
jgi:hypothetical protein